MFKSTQMKLNSRFLFLLFFSVKIVLISDRSITRLFWRFNYHHFFRVSFLSRANRVPLPPPTERKETFFCTTFTLWDFVLQNPRSWDFFCLFHFRFSLWFFICARPYCGRDLFLSQNFVLFTHSKKSNNTWPGKRRQVVTPLIVAETRWFKSP